VSTFGHQVPLSRKTSEGSGAGQRPTKSHKSAFGVAPQVPPRTERHSAAHPGTRVKTVPNLSDDQRKRRSSGGTTVQVMCGQGAGSNRRPSAFQKVYHRPGSLCLMQLHSPLYQQMGLSGACGSSLAGVPTCAG